MGKKNTKKEKKELTKYYWKPEFIYIHNKEGLKRFNKLAKKPRTVIFDEIESQIKELIELMNPEKGYSYNELENSIKEHLNGVPKTHYGVWVFYPWSNRLVHILDEEEFALVRTNRNCNKITEEERQYLSTKRVGIIGLSVGSSVALTMAQERGFGELRLADFDLLELTNLNRIRTGIHNLGINKSINVAREIMEIDPFLKLSCFTEGINEKNIERFLIGNGKLDVLIDECDSVDIKFLCRLKARELEIPVVMETSDRGMVDIERFDLEPTRPIFHGLTDGLDLEKLKTLKTSEEKVPYLLAIIGLDTISERAKLSLLEIGKTLKTWPQLASAIALGGGVLADVIRRILLNVFKDSGRYYIDIEELIKNHNNFKTNKL